MAEIHCRHFNGYKPCGKSEDCSRACAHFDEIHHSVVLIHLGALGAVLRSTSLLPAIHRRFSRAAVTWITSAPAHHLLAHNPLLHRVLTTEPEDLLQLRALQADAVFCIDKSLTAVAISQMVTSADVRGFTADPRTGAILPAGPAARELWEMGLSNEKKFFQNQKTEQRLVHEALELGTYSRDPYCYTLTDAERAAASSRRSAWAPQGEILVGLNTGCSGVIPYKKLSVKSHRELVARLHSVYGKRVRVVLLGGPEDELRNREIAQGLDVVLSPQDRGLRDGVLSVAACDVVVSGDSLGLHMAIAQKKWVVAWFGPTCAQEIDLYDHGVKVITRATCSPCWKRVCDKNPMCYDLVDLGEIIAGVEKGIRELHEPTTTGRSNRLSRRPSSLHPSSEANS